MARQDGNMSIRRHSSSCLVANLIELFSAHRCLEQRSWSQIAGELGEFWWQKETTNKVVNRGASPFKDRRLGTGKVVYIREESRGFTENPNPPSNLRQ